MADPHATKEVEDMRDISEVLENRSKRNNLRADGVTQGKEIGNCITFLNKFLPAEQ